MNNAQTALLAAAIEASRSTGNRRTVQEIHENAADNLIWLEDHAADD